MKNRWIALLLVSSVLAAPLCAATYYVDASVAHLAAMRLADAPDWDGSAEFPFGTIQEAIEAAADGDTIVVAPGYYLWPTPPELSRSPDPWKYAELNFKGKSVRLVSSAPTDFGVAEQTVLCGVIVFDGTEDPNCLLQGFKIQNHTCGGILGNGTQATISHCILSGNGPCGATVIKDVYGELRNCLIVDNTTFHDCGTGPVVSGCPTIVNCTIANNLAGVEIYNAASPYDSQITVRNCIIHGNQGAPVTATLKGIDLIGNFVEYSLVDNWSPSNAARSRPPYNSIEVADPCFVRPGYWVDASTATRPATRGSTPTTTTGNKILIEGDYHLRTEGWRWSPEPAHGSHWYFDTRTSRAIDGGDPMDGLGEELERAPADPEGVLGVNHAIDMGAYGGTIHASLAPTSGEAPGFGAVYLRDYWPLAVGNSWTVHNPNGGTAPRLQAYSLSITGYQGVALSVRNASDWAQTVYCVYLNRTLYMTQVATDLYKLPAITGQFEAQYPLYPVPGSIIQTPYNPFIKGASLHQPTMVQRGPLSEVLADTSVDPALLLDGSWQDVIAFREITLDGTPGEPIAIFARGFGPLMIAGLPVEGAVINSRVFGTSRTATRGGG